MQVLMKSDNQVSGDRELTEFVQGEVDRALERFEERLMKPPIRGTRHLRGGDPFVIALFELGMDRVLV
jgi:hypothetical protein